MLTDQFCNFIADTPSSSGTSKTEFSNIFLNTKKILPKHFVSIISNLVHRTAHFAVHLCLLPLL